MATSTSIQRSARKRRSVGPAPLTDDEQRAYEAVPAEIDYVDHACFASSAAEEELLGRCGAEIDVPAFALPSEVPEHLDLCVRARISLSVKQERTLFLQYNYAKHRLRALLRRRGRASAKRAREIIAWHTKAMAIRSKIAHANMALVPAMARRAQSPKVEFGELISEGYMAVLRCIEKFDVSRGFKFSTYACRAVLKSFHRLARKTTRYQKLFPVELDPALDPGDEAEQRADRQRSDCIDIIREILKRNHANLTDLERKVILERFAIRAGGKARTLCEVGQMIGLSKERVRLIQKASLSKLRDAFDAQLAS